MIRCLNLDPEFIPIPYPEVRHDWIQFPAGERQIRLNTNINYSNIDKVIITARYSKYVGDRLLMEIAIAVDALKRVGINKFDLILPYFPHSRQDRVTVKGESLTLGVFSTLLEELMGWKRGWKNIHTFDMHSESGVIMTNAKSKNNHEFFGWAYVKMNLFQRPILISPDAGAKEKSEKLYQYSPDSFNTISYCSKRRDPQTGKLSGFETGHPNYMGKPCIIVDDICDGGGTFIGLAKELKKANAGDLYLVVSHGIFSKGLYALTPHFEQIFTTNSYKRYKTNNQNLFDYLDDRCHEYKLQW